MDVNDLISMFNKVNRDCEQKGERVVPLTDVDFYSEQINNLYDLGEEESMRLANEISIQLLK